MDTASFFAQVLPSQGNKVLAELVPFKDKQTGATRDGWRYTTYQSFDAMAEAVAQFDAQGRTIYHACNAFGDWYQDEANGKRRLRTQVNVVACRALYDDIDIGKLGCHASKKEAMTALSEMLAATGMPTPLVVDSGGGLHLYWACSDDITPEAWFEMAVLKRRITTHFNIKVDHAVDLDKARVLRPVGSFNRKREPREVVAKNAPAPTDADTLRGIMQKFIDDNGVPGVRVSSGGKLKNAFGAALETDYPASYADKIAEHCAVIKWFKETGAPDEPAWHKCIGALKHAEDGQEKIHEWSSKYAGYSAGETQQKIDAWIHGPTTCEVMRQVTPELCGACTKNVKSPIQLGHVETTLPADPERVVEHNTEAAGGTAMAEADLLKKIWPARFSERNGKLYKSTTSADGVVEDICFCDTLFYPIALVRNEEGAWEVTIEYIAIHGEKRRFNVATSDIVSPDKLAGALAAHTVFIYNKGGKIMASEFARLGALALQHHKREIITEEAFGWTADGNGFVIGNTRITADGESAVHMSEHVRNGGMAIDYGTAGDRHKWVSLVNEIYNRPGAEPYQFAFLVAAASPLVNLVGIDNFHGVPVAYTGPGGRGKTTACELACSMWGRGELFKQSSNKAGTTMNGLVAKTAIYRHLPWVMDELTGQKTEEISDMLYGLSNGQNKVRLSSSGSFANKNLKWDLFSFVTGNMDITGLLNAMGGQMSDAVQVRCFEVKVPEDLNETVFRGMNAKQLIDIELRGNYGVVGREILRYYMSKRAKVTAAVHTLRQRYNPSTADETRERFYIDLICFAMVAGSVMKKLDIIRFDLDAILKWAFENIKSLRRARAEKNYTGEELIGQFLATLHDKTMVTKHIRNLRSGDAPEAVTNIMREAPQARLATVDRRYIVTAKAINDWCKENDVTAGQFRDTLDKHGYILHISGREKTGAYSARIGMGTTHVTGVSRCYELDYSKVYGHGVDESKRSATVTSLPVVAQIVTHEAEDATVSQVTV